MTKIRKQHSQVIKMMRSAGRSTQEIYHHLESVGVHATMSTIRRHYKERILTKRKPRKLNQDVIAATENILNQNQQMAASFVKKQLRDNGMEISERSIRRIKRKLGWRYNKKVRCPVLNKEMRLRQAQKWIDEKELFHNVIFSGEITLALDGFTTAPISTTKRHPSRVHVWGAISRLGAGPLVIFEGLMDSSFFEHTIIRETAGPYIRHNFGVHHRFVQDNDPKHTAAGKVIATEGINWMKTPEKSPDLNPIEMVWLELKEYLRIEAQPATKTELTAAINKFWFEELTEKKCNQYINQLLEVLPAVVKNQGGYTGMSHSSNCEND